MIKIGTTERMQLLKAKHAKLETNQESTLALNSAQSLTGEQDDQSDCCGCCRGVFSQGNPMQGECLFQCDAHKFHEDCIQKYLQKNSYPRGPFCRSLLKGASSIDIFVAALANQDAQTAITLINEGSLDVNAGDPNGEHHTPHRYAIYSEYHDVVQTLLNHPDIDVNKPWKIGANKWPPLMHLVLAGDFNGTQTLLNNPNIDLNINPSNYNGWTPLRIARMYRYRDIEALLKAHGAI